jgi:hypothetical protein
MKTPATVVAAVAMASPAARAIRNGERRFEGAGAIAVIAALSAREPVRYGA